MRVRKKKHTPERMARCHAYFLEDPSVLLDPVSVFGNDNPVHAEIGCGKGLFVCRMAQRHPDINFVAFEKVPDVIVMAMEKAFANQLSNVRFVCADALLLPEVIRPHTLDRLYLNFSDPWKKSRQKKRRLTYRTFLEIYKQVLKYGAEIWFKTDNTPLYELSLEEFRLCGFELKNLTDDLHNSAFAAENIMTEYEKAWSEKGFPIHRCEAVCPLQDTPTVTEDETDA